MLRHVAPAGTPVGAAALAGWLGGLVRGEDHAQALAEAVCVRQGLRYALPISTGRAGLVTILRALARLAPPGRRRVVIPSYTCYTVAASVVHAGLSPLAVDISLDTLDFNRAALERVDFSDVLAIVPTSLFGLPSDLPYITALARRHGIRVVDDAAQALGASIGGCPSGTWGDAGLYSLDKGKNITTIDGGLAVTMDADVARELAAEAAGLAPRRTAAVATDAMKLVAYAALLRPRLYWIPNTLPGLALGTTHYPAEIALERYAGALAAMGLVMLPRLDRLNDDRRVVAAALDRLVSASPRVAAVRPHPGAHAVYLRYPVLAASRADRDALIAAFIARGIGATGSYPLAIVDVPELGSHIAAQQNDCPIGRAVADRLITLPTHGYVTARDLRAIGEVLGGRAAVPSAAYEPLA